MSQLHSIYAWGVVFVVIFATLFLLIFGKENWNWLALIFAIIPLVSFILYLGTTIPDLKTPEHLSGVLELMKSKTLWLCVLMIFFACALTGLCTSMLWPGSLLVATDRFPMGGVFIYAMMAASGDLGASVAPQIVGIVTDLLSFVRNSFMHSIFLQSHLPSIDSFPKVFLQEVSSFLSLLESDESY